MANSDLLDGGLCSLCFEIVHGTLWVEVKTIPSLFPFLCIIISETHSAEMATQTVVRFQTMKPNVLKYATT